MSITAADFKVRFPEFVSISDTTITTMIGRAELRLNENLWGTWYDEGLYYLSAHFLGRTFTSVQTGAAGPIASKSVGDVSISFTNPTPTDAGEAFFLSTTYGAEFWSMAAIVGTQLGVVGWNDV